MCWFFYQRGKVHRDKKKKKKKTNLQGNVMDEVVLA
jgi:hypothetical protein